MTISGDEQATKSGEETFDLAYIAARLDGIADDVASLLERYMAVLSVPERARLASVVAGFREVVASLYEKARS